MLLVSISCTALRICQWAIAPTWSRSFLVELRTDTGRKSTGSTHLRHVGTASFRLSHCCIRPSPSTKTGHRPVSRNDAPSWRIIPTHLPSLERFPGSNTAAWVLVITRLRLSDALATIRKAQPNDDSKTTISLGTSINDVTREGRGGPGWCDDVWRKEVGDGKVLWRHARYTGKCWCAVYSGIT